MAKLIILPTLSGIRQDLVRFSDLFEFLLCLWIARIDVGMVLPGKLSIRPFDLPL